MSQFWGSFNYAKIVCDQSDRVCYVFEKANLKYERKISTVVIKIL